MTIKLADFSRKPVTSAGGSTPADEPIGSWESLTAPTNEQLAHPERCAQTVGLLLDTGETIFATCKPFCWPGMAQPVVKAVNVGAWWTLPPGAEWSDKEAMPEDGEA